MKRVLVIAALGLSLAGCTAMDNFIAGLKFASTGVNNPVTPTMLYNVENTATLAFAGLKAYKQSCVNGALPPSCKGVVTSIQAYTKQIPQVLIDLRKFVKNNDQINAMAAYNTIVVLISDAKAVATANNVKVQ